MHEVPVPVEHLPRIVALTRQHFDNRYVLTREDLAFLAAQTRPNFYCACPTHVAWRKRELQRWEQQLAASSNGQ